MARIYQRTSTTCFTLIFVASGLVVEGITGKENKKEIQHTTLKNNNSLFIVWASIAWIYLIEFAHVLHRCTRDEPCLVCTQRNMYLYLFDRLCQTTLMRMFVHTRTPLDIVLV